MSSRIDTEKMSAHLRVKAINVEEKEILITKFTGSLQENDLSEPTNCQGYGRIRHFNLGGKTTWPLNPLPIYPANNALQRQNTNSIRAQVFQNSVCNWRCWYCFVDYSLLNGDKKRADFFTCEELLDMYLDQSDPPSMIDLTGGQPDLTPEWIPWMMEAVIKKGLYDKIYLWSDDNLSNDYFWQYLSPSQLKLVQDYKMYSRVCCFKGIDEKSFSLNTKASPSLFNSQFDLCNRLIDFGLDLYSYVTLTANTDTRFDYTIPMFLDRLQRIDENLPLRTVPLEIFEFSPVLNRMTNVYHDMIKGQYIAIGIWLKEMEKRFPLELRSKPITDIDLYPKKWKKKLY